jgi:NAD(P)-dependent dehydrogenase (short-subunit alcohol dehydrogenase family)
MSDFTIISHKAWATELYATMARSFDASTTGSSVAETFSSAVTGKAILITGVNKGGLGGTMAEILSRHAPKTLVLASRTPAKVHEVIDELQAKYQEVTYIAVPLDLSSPESCRQAASSLLSNPDIKQIDLLFNNAAVMNVPERELSADGIEIQFATNHLGHFLFTNLVMPKILAAAKVNPKGATRIVNVSSLATAYGPIRFSDINFDQPFDALPPAEQPNYEAIAEF